MLPVTVAVELDVPTCTDVHVQALAYFFTDSIQLGAAEGFSATSSDSCCGVI
jgi:hypothetical protein